jgi:hypothetical protein
MQQLHLFSAVDRNLHLWRPDGHLVTMMTTVQQGIFVDDVFAAAVCS